jgi:exopolysaccharide biosynthesis polyprenyl glycosylphosphotransferase
VVVHTEFSAPRPWQARYVAALVAADGAIVVATLAAYGIRYGFGNSALSDQVPLPFLALVPVAWVATVALCGVYDVRRIGNGAEEYRGILNAAVRFLATIGVLTLAFRLSPGRVLVGGGLLVVTAVTTLNHHMGRRWLGARRRDGLCSQRVLVVGLEHQVAELVRHFRRAGDSGLTVVGACVAGDLEKIDIDDEPVPVVGQPGDVVAALRRVNGDVVAIADHDSLSNGALRRLGWQLEGTGVDLLVAPSVVDVAGPRIVVRPVGGLPLLHVEEPNLTGFSRIAKRVCEQILATILLVILSPLLFAIAIAIRCTSRGPAVFRQARIGQGGRPFTLYKFRTMRGGAEDERDALANLNDLDGPLFKIRDDPRRTPLGRWLRRYSLDELPQLWNVLTGRMSIVGPRPPLPVEVDQYDDHVRRRLLVKPGITGLWQVSGRSDLPWQEATRLDLYYVENWSPELDLVILAKTVTAVVRGRGAY